MNDAPSDATPQRTLLAAKSEYLEGFSRLLGLARRELCIFDPDLSALDMNSAARIEALNAFLRDSRTRRVFIALHDIEHVTKRCPRLLALLGSFPAAMFIQQTQGDAAKVQDCFTIADAEHFVRRPVTAQARGVLVLNDPRECQPIRDRFTEIWESSLQSVSVNTAGL